MTNNLSDFSLDYFSVQDKVAIVTGGNKGLGQAYAVALAKAGADLFIVTHGTEWDETRALIEETGRKVEFFQADLRDQSKTSRARCKMCGSLWES